jgi:hypothetical protein
LEAGLLPHMMNFFRDFRGAIIRCIAAEKLAPAAPQPLHGMHPVDGIYRLAGSVCELFQSTHVSEGLVMHAGSRFVLLVRHIMHATLPFGAPSWQPAGFTTAAVVHPAGLQHAHANVGQ